MKTYSFLRSRSLLWIIMLSGLLFTACDEDDAELTELNNEANIVLFSFEEFTPPVIGSIDSDEFVVTVTVPEGTDRTNLVPTIIVSENATVGPGSGVANVFIHNMTYVVTAENGRRQEWVINVNLQE